MNRVLATIITLVAVVLAVVVCWVAFASGDPNAKEELKDTKARWIAVIGAIGVLIKWVFDAWEKVFERAERAERTVSAVTRKTWAARGSSSASKSTTPVRPRSW
jgi:hypothetical protein